MPSTYTPDPTATQAPAATPDPDNYPLLSLPSDGDAANAASVAQDFKALGDFVAWLKAPRAKVSSASQAVRKYMNSRLHRGNVINNQGILDGRVLTSEEDWIDIAAVDKGTAIANGSWFGRWKYGIFGDGGSVFGSGPATSPSIAPWGSRGGVTIIGGTFPFAQSAAVVEMCKAFMRGGSAPYICMETAISVNPNGAGTLDAADTYSIGFSGGTLVSSADTSACDTGAMSSVAGAYLVKLTGNTTWTVVDRAVGGGGGASTATGVTVTADTPLRYRVEILRAAAAGDNAVHVIHYVNGTAIDHATDMDGAMLVPFFRTSGQYSGPNVHSVLNVGRIRLTARIELGDVYL